MDFRRLQALLLEEIRARIRNGEMTERGLARLAGISQPHIHNVLKGVRVLSLEGTDRVLRRLGVNLMDLLADQEPRNMVGACRLVPLLDGFLGPAYPFPKTPGPARYPFAAENVDGLPDPVAVRLAAPAGAAPPFAGGSVLLLERSNELGSDAGAGGYFALDLGSGGCIGLARPGEGLWLWNARGTWEPAEFTGRRAADLVRARIRLLIRPL